MGEEEIKALKMMRFYQEDYMQKIRQLQEDGEPEGYGTMIDVYKGYICNIDLVLQLVSKLKSENALLKHRLETANDFIEIRIESLIPENYEDLKYILNECGLESTW